MKKGLYISGLLILSIFLLAACSSVNKAQAPDTPYQEATQSKSNKIVLTISAAASLKDALEVIQKQYEQEHPEVTLRFNFGASGSLQQQITQGAPVDLFFSAAEDKFDLLVVEGTILVEDSIDLLSNELVLIVPKKSDIISSSTDLSTASYDHIAIGTPETVPAGKYAKAALERMGIWSIIESKIVFAKDVRQVLSYVETGNVEAGIVYKTDALISDKVEITQAVDKSMHEPIIYPVGIVKSSKYYDQAKDFYHYLQLENTLKVFDEYGFNIR